MSEFQIAYVPIGVPTFHLESAGKCFEESIRLLNSISQKVVYPEEMLLSIDLLNNYLDRINPGLIILQNVTFANAAYAGAVVKAFPNVPIVLWALREPVIDGGRLRLNSLTGAFSASNAIHGLKDGKVPYIFGAPSEEKVNQKLSAAVKAAETLYKMKSLKVAAIGHTPQGFGFGRALDLEMQRVFGAELISIEARELIDVAKGFSEKEVKAYLEDAGSRMTGLENTPENNRVDFGRLYKAYDEYVKNNNIKAVASRCWPDFFTAFGTPVCAVLAMLNDLGVAAACETDTYGALSMYIGMEMSGNPTFFGDPVSMDEEENTITFWHCGTAACSLAKDGCANVDVHCNRKIGPTLDFGCRPEKRVTVFRIGRKSDGTFRFFLAGGEALDKPKQFNGTCAVIKTDGDVKQIIGGGIGDGWEPHFVVVYGDVSEAIKMLGDMMNIEVSEY